MFACGEEFGIGQGYSDLVRGQPFLTVLGIPEIDDRTFISSPGYPTSYSENTYCYWEVDVPYDVEVILEFNSRSVAFDRPHFISVLIMDHMIWAISNGI